MNLKDILFGNKENIYNNFPDAIVVLDFMRNIIVWNNKAEVLFGYKKIEVKNKNITMLFNEDFERFNKIIGLPHGTILRATTKTGENIFVDVTAYDAHNSAHIIVSIRALSNKFLELQNLLDDYQMTKMLVSNRDSYLSNLKFDFLTPLNAAIGFSQSLLDGICGNLNEKQIKYLNIINSNNKKAKKLMDRALALIELDADKKEFNFKNFDFLKIIEFTIDKYKKEIENKELKISSIIETEKRNAFSDEYCIVQVMEILIENAIKFTSKGEILISVSHPNNETLEFQKIKIPAGYSEKSYLQINVRDTGIGIIEERLPEVFNEYLAKNLEIAQKYEGTALSLPIARKIIHKLNGEIWCTKNYPQGSIFSFVIPIERMSFEQ